MFLISQRCNISRPNCFISRLKIKVYKLNTPVFAYCLLISTPGTGMEKQRGPCTNWVSLVISTTHMRTQFSHSWELLALSHTHRGTIPFFIQLLKTIFSFHFDKRSYLNKEKPLIWNYLPTSAQAFTLLQLS